MKKFISVLVATGLLIGFCLAIVFLPYLMGLLLQLFGFIFPDVITCWGAGVLTLLVVGGVSWSVYTIHEIIKDDVNLRIESYKRDREIKVQRKQRVKDMKHMEGSLSEPDVNIMDGALSHE